MKLGKIKLESLMMIFPGEAINVPEDSMEEALEGLKSDPNFSDYLANMPGIINRCFGLLENKGVLPTKQVELVEGSEENKLLRYDLKTVIPDYGILERVAFECANGEGYTSECEYMRESADVILLPYMGKGKLILIYTPRIKRVSLISSENTEVLPERDDITSLIPYYVKSELLYTEHPDDAKLARSLFEQGLGELVSHKEGYQSKVETVFRVV